METGIVSAMATPRGAWISKGGALSSIGSAPRSHAKAGSGTAMAGTAMAEWCEAKLSAAKAKSRAEKQRQS